MEQRRKEELEGEGREKERMGKKIVLSSSDTQRKRCGQV